MSTSERRGPVPCQYCGKLPCACPAERVELTPILYCHHCGAALTEKEVRDTVALGVPVAVWLCEKCQ